MERSTVAVGGTYDRWDMQVRAGSLGAARLRLAIEEHGGGRQLLRFRAWPRWSRGGLALTAGFVAFCAASAARGSVASALILGLLALTVVVRMLRECGDSLGLCLQGLRQDEPDGDVSQGVLTAIKRLQEADLSLALETGTVADQSRERPAGSRR
jgi:hypothetical protein